VLGVAAAIVLLGESPRALQLVGGAVVVLSTAVVSRAGGQVA
jgi:drug/metabolite transporter (DMT)-like permease